MTFEHNIVRKNLFLSACFCWDSRLSLREMDQKFKFGGLIGYGNPYSDSAFCYSKKIRLHSILHDAAGAVRSHSGKGPGYCYMTGRGPNSFLLGHVTGLLFCLYVKFLLPSIFDSVDLDAFGEFTSQKLVTNQLFGSKFCVLRQDTFHPHQDYEQVNFYKEASLYFIGWSFRNWKIAAYLQLAKNWNILFQI